MEIWGENIIIEQDDGWFVGTQFSALFHVDFQKKMYDPLLLLPTEDLYGYEIYECCNKVDKFIYIHPRHTAGNIFVMNLAEQSLQEIVIDNPNKLDVDIVGTCLYNDKIYAMSLGLHNIIVLDIKSNTIIDTYEIFKDVDIQDKNGKMLLLGNELYCSVYDSNELYMLNVDNHIWEKYVIKELKNGISSFGSAGSKLWFTSKEMCIYLWDKSENSIVRIDNFPKEFGIYKFDSNNQLFIDTTMQFDPEGFFCKGVCLNGRVWLIPCRENKIIYFEVDTLLVRELLLADEIENEYTWGKNQLKVKFCMCYIRQERYIGVYSFKNKCIFEIDTQLLKTENVNLTISSNGMQYINSKRIMHSMGKYGFVMEIADMNLCDYLKNIPTHKSNVNKKRNNGRDIHNYLSKLLT